jgi:hypothetical protein
MDLKDKIRWGKVRSKGKYHYVLIRGGLIWGFPLGLIWNAFELFRNDYFLFLSGFLYKGLFMLFGFFLGGCLFATYQWSAYEKKYLSADDRPIQ